MAICRATLVFSVPWIASAELCCTDPQEASRKISEIQNASLGEYRIRELNDEINKLLREKVFLGASASSLPKGATAGGV